MKKIIFWLIFAEEKIKYAFKDDTRDCMCSCSRNSHKGHWTSWLINVFVYNVQEGKIKASPWPCKTQTSLCVHSHLTRENEFQTYVKSSCPQNLHIKQMVMDKQSIYDETSLEPDPFSHNKVELFHWFLEFMRIMWFLYISRLLQCLEKCFHVLRFRNFGSKSDSRE